MLSWNPSQKEDCQFVVRRLKTNARTRKGPKRTVANKKK